MKLKLTTWILALATIVFPITAIYLVPDFAMRLGAGTEDPDLIQFYGAALMLALLFLTPICGFTAIGLWYYRRNQKKKYFEGLQL